MSSNQNRNLHEIYPESVHYGNPRWTHFTGLGWIDFRYDAESKIRKYIYSVDAEGLSASVGYSNLLDAMLQLDRYILENYEKITNHTLEEAERIINDG